MTAQIIPFPPRPAPAPDGRSSAERIAAQLVHDLLGKKPTGVTETGWNEHIMELYARLYHECERA